MNNLEFKLTACYNLGSSGFHSQKSGGVQNFGPNFKNFQFWPFLSFEKF